MFIDASAIVAMLTREAEADVLADVLEAARSAITSPIAVFEAVLGICRKPGHSDTKRRGLAPSPTLWAVPRQRRTFRLHAV